MTQWTTFAGITGVVLVLLLVLSHLTQTAFSGADSDRDGDSTALRPESTDADRTDRSPSSSSSSPRAGSTDTHAKSDFESADSNGTSPSESDADRRSPETGRPADPSAETWSDRADLDRPSWPGEFDRGPGRGVDPGSLSTGMVLANVAASQGLFALVLLGAIVVTGIPLDALGIDLSRAYLETGLRLGTACGLVLYVANEIGSAAATRFGFDHDERLRELLAPDSVQGWLVLLFLVLPIIAVFEELLFRAALIGVLSTGFGLSPWPLAIGSSIAFALGHGMQGTIGIVVTGVLGFVLATIFIVTESFLVVVVAHYLINALEFVVHEGFEFEWAEILES
ncbi:CPBP family intramembrane glutamic endopeptidase [Halosolutus gelatinilyticus]|uniref:CPBP family intramembrane glutamic endopeptidase n=1 Tax=Halosolutus gelatinilyticus TaxID=2931975 RepID=UPI001FF3B33C|nr:CPBP family glutamic-type intramembrane protease [Halosolutus gelatinilyticus]